MPLPHSGNTEYSERAISQYEQAVELAGGEPVRIELHNPSDVVRRTIEGCDGVLLPGSNADVDPAKFGAVRSPHTTPADPLREEVDALLLEDAETTRKPVLAICYGLQSLNVYRKGSLVQHIPDFLSHELRGRVNHEAGSKVPIAHKVEVAANSRLAAIVRGHGLEEGTRPPRTDLPLHRGDQVSGARDQHPPTHDPRTQEHDLLLDRGRAALQGRERNTNLNGASAPEDRVVLAVNSSHHQSANAVGNRLRISARCVEDGIIEALEGTSPDHFLLAVQWHPERSVDAHSRALFRAFVEVSNSKVRG